jgi:hypothetical protein
MFDSSSALTSALRATFSVTSLATRAASSAVAPAFLTPATILDSANSSKLPFLFFIFTRCIASLCYFRVNVLYLFCVAHSGLNGLKGNAARDIFRAHARSVDNSKYGSIVFGLRKDCLYVEE